MTMTLKERLADIIIKVEAGETPNQDDFRKVFGWHTDVRHQLAVIACDPSDIRAMGAAKALHEAVLCSDDPQYGYMVGPMYARIVHPSCGTVCDAISNTPARAWLLAILKAFSAKEGT